METQKTRSFTYFELVNEAISDPELSDPALVFELQNLIDQIIGDLEPEALDDTATVTAIITLIEHDNIELPPIGPQIYRERLQLIQQKCDGAEWIARLFIATEQALTYYGMHEGQDLTPLAEECIEFCKRHNFAFTVGSRD
jgi:hypothetical protein